MSTADKIGQLLYQKRYDPDILPDLARYLDSQLKGEVEYDAEANLALVKIIQFTPNVENGVDIVVKAIVAALTRLPEVETPMISSMLPHTLSGNARVQKALALAGAIDAGGFSEFWSLRNDEVNKKMIDHCTDFDKKLRTYIMSLLKSVYRTVRLSEFASVLSQTEEEAKATVSAADGWSVIDRDGVAFVQTPHTGESELAPKAKAQKVAFEQVSRAI